MKHILLPIAFALTAGCANSPERVTRSTLDITVGTNHIKSSTPKEYKIKKLKWTDAGFEVEGLTSAANADAIESQMLQAQMQQQGFQQALQLFNSFGGMAAQYFSGGAMRPPLVVTNYVQLPPIVVTNYMPQVISAPAGSTTFVVPAVTTTTNDTPRPAATKAP